MKKVIALLIVLLGSACGDDSSATDAGTFLDGAVRDAGRNASDAAATDAEVRADVPSDAGVDAPAADSGPPAAGSVALRVVADRGAAASHRGAVPFAPGVLTDVTLLRLVDEAGEEVVVDTNVLATWPRDGSVRSVLLGFDADLSLGEEARFELQYGAAASTPGAAAVYARDPQSVVLVDGEWLAGSRASGPLVSEASNTRFPDFDSQVTRYLENMSPPFEDFGVSCRGTNAHRTYYDSPHTTWIYYQRAAGVERFRRAEAESQWYRDNELEWVNGRDMAVQVCQGSDWSPDDKIDWGVIRRMTGQGMLDDYLLTGNPDAREAIVAMGEAFIRSLPAQLGGRENSLRVTERNLAWTLMGVAAYYAVRPEPEVRAGLDMLLEEAVSWQAAGSTGAFEHDIVRPDPDECSDGPAGASPFMTSLLVDGLMDAHMLIDDPRIADVVEGVATWFRDDAVTPDGDAFRYLWGCASNGYEDTSSELNNLIVHVFGAAAWVSDDVAWLDAGDSFADAGLTALYAGRPKQWNQTVRGFSRYIGYRAAFRAP